MNPEDRCGSNQYRTQKVASCDQREKGPSENRIAKSVTVRPVIGRETYRRKDQKKGWRDDGGETGTFLARRARKTRSATATSATRPIILTFREIRPIVFGVRIELPDVS